MTINQHKLLFVMIIISSIIILFLSIYDIAYGKEWLLTILAIYTILIVLTILLLSVTTKKKTREPKDTVEEFEKTLEGELFHFKCPQCKGIFAIKKSKRNSKKPFTLTCPDCGTVGKISGSPPVVVEKIPEHKSKNIKFKCKNCGEYISIWAEGTKLVQNIKIYSCPYCGEEQSMKSI